MISANILSGPFLEPFAEASFQSILPLVDEIIVVDTSPGTNPNAEINTKYATTIIDFFGGGTAEFSFASAREAARTASQYEWVLRLDQDEVLHEKDITSLKTATEDNRFDVIEVAFYHFMVYPWLYQYIEPKAILLRTNNFSWINGVHEVPNFSGRTRKLHEIKYYHMGYCRGQAEVMKRWQLYVDIDGRSDWYKGTNPNTILEDRISVCQNFTGSFPKVLEPALDKLFPNWREMYEGD